MKTGRPRAEIDLNQVEIFGKFRATYETMAAYFDVTERTIKGRMADKDSDFFHHYKKGLADLQLKLSEAQIETALIDKVPSMQIWLGKQHLGQKDKQEVEQSGTITTVTVVEEFKKEE
jgi:hypothetical protein